MNETLGIMQPYFFPYIGYFQLIAAVQRGLVFDIVKYKRKSWMNRNRVLGSKGDWQYINVPVCVSKGALIKDATIIDLACAHRRIKNQLEHYRSQAPYFRETLHVVEQTFGTPATHLCELNTRALKVVCEYLGMSFNWESCAAMNLDLPPIEHAGQWALEISTVLGARQYINATGGREIFIPGEWQERGIELRFLEPASFSYSTGPLNFVENLSIIDVLMWNAPETVLAYLHNETRAVI
ncbi:WbqC family protein [Pseudomonas fragariae (ex Marin et al. 2024)]|uniref:WbqC family protein n=2 Tax=Pseudomonas fragariae (ex Marin et al. 2024) TaxID=3080056 RepID=A0ABT3LDG2_9PSED|nr:MULTISPECIES: WbqC family protein [unclassified Pseudomonas]MCW6054504.1 WbqC family protein [Pseudomonas fragi]MDV0424571.1 WbqC family protein [Pseudomonas sp. 17]MDX9570330.1 WbqC family protein [Pseudomonas sp. 21(2023)]MDX9584123.1 WbqC family protein [Pseudomonas sp. 19(2023)]MDX9621754.1 WbqC family protein [Pseudomonas sp. 20]